MIFFNTVLLNLNILDDYENTVIIFLVKMNLCTFYLF
jgi:hypothetical protein